MTFSSANAEGRVSDEQPISFLPTPALGFGPVRFAEFRGSVPPAQTRVVIPRVRTRSIEKQRDGSEVLRDVSFDIPQIQIHCPADTCNGQRFFRVNTAELKHLTAPVNKWWFEYVTYICANCQHFAKIFGIALSIRLSDKPLRGAQFSYALLCYKIGEAPPFGPTTPARLISLIGPDRDLFLKGRTCENQGLGIGAFGYYRRVVENQKNRILAEIIKVAQLLSMLPDT